MRENPASKSTSKGTSAPSKTWPETRICWPVTLAQAPNVWPPGNVATAALR